MRSFFSIVATPIAKVICPIGHPVHEGADYGKKFDEYVAKLAHENPMMGESARRKLAVKRINEYFTEKDSYGYEVTVHDALDHVFDHNAGFELTPMMDWHHG